MRPHVSIAVWMIARTALRSCYRIAVGYRLTATLSDYAGGTFGNAFVGPVTMMRRIQIVDYDPSATAGQFAR